MFIRRLYFVTTACLLSYTPLFAQSDNSVDTIIVSASRSPLERPQIGGAVTVISRDQIEMRQSRYVTDVLRAVPGFSVSQTGANGSQTQVRVRGADPRGEGHRPAMNAVESVGIDVVGKA